VSIPDLKIIDEYEFAEGNLAMIIGGKHTGRVGIIRKIESVQSPLPGEVKLEGEKEEFSTIKPNVFVIGKEKSEIKLPAQKTEVIT
jgi:small subunit ribosomal protein S4e